MEFRFLLIDSGPQLAASLLEKLRLKRKDEYMYGSISAADK